MFNPLILILLVVAIILAYNLNNYLAEHHEDQWWAVALAIVLAPGTLTAFIIIIAWALAFAALSAPYFMLYPERRETIWDVEGTDDQKLALSEYRSKCAKRSFVRRFLETFLLFSYSGPEWPQILKLSVNLFALMPPTCPKCHCEFKRADQPDCTNCDWLRTLPYDESKWGNVGPCPSCGFEYRWDGIVCSHCGLKSKIEKC